ncbi:MAG: (Fe-S)-binding protein [Bacillaceae bacterium]|nr:(Fe-S)-binding protein [Bacillaceae bacterium]
MCLDACPTYQETGLEHQSPRGRVYLIKSVAEGRMNLNESFKDPIFQCLDCRACETACPSGVQVGSLIEEARGQIHHADPPRGVKGTISKFFLREVFPHTSRLHKLGKLTRFYQKSGAQRVLRKTGLLNILPPHLKEMEQVLPEVGTPVKASMPEVVEPEGEKRARVAILTGCVMDIMFSEVNAATVRSLVTNGCEVVIPKQQECCGALQVHAGDRETAKELARRNIDVFLDANVDKVIVNAAGCGAALKEYGELLQNDPAYREKAEIFSEKVEDVSKFLVDLGIRKPEGKVETRVTYHDACHLAHAQGVRQEPRKLLENIDGVELVELPDADRCCGSAGIYNITHPDMAGRLLDRKIEDIPDEVEVVAMGNPGCMMQIALGIHRHQRKEQVLHTIQILDMAYQNEQKQKQTRFIEAAATQEGSGSDENR